MVGKDDASPVKKNEGARPPGEGSSDPADSQATGDSGSGVDTAGGGNSSSGKKKGKKGRKKQGRNQSDTGETAASAGTTAAAPAPVPAPVSPPSHKLQFQSMSVLKDDKPLFWACAAVVAIMTARLIHMVMLHPLRIGWDPALHLNAAQLITRGKVPYVDMFDVNPPLIWYLDMIPSYLSAIFNFPVTQSFNLFLVGLILYSVATCLILLFTKAKRAEAPFFMPFLIGLTLFNFFLRYDFGQREEIFVLLYMPLFILRWLRWQGRGVESKVYSAIIGFIGAVGICLKPYFLIPAVLVELYFLLDKGKWSRLFTVETVTCFAGGVLYLGHFLLAPEAMRKTYFEFVVPAFQLGYHFWDTSLGASLSDPGKRDVFLLMAVSSLLAVALRRKCSLMLPLVVFLMAGVIPYLLQFKGWAYHDQPVYAAGFILACMEVGFIKILIAQKLHQAATAIGEKTGRKVEIPRNVLLAGLVLIALGIAIYDGHKDAREVAEEPRRFDMSIIGYKGESPWSDIHGPYTELVLDGYKLGDKAIVMSNAVTPGYPWLTQLRFEPGSRHLHMVILSVLSYIKDVLPHTDENKKLYNEMDRIVLEYAEDIKNNRPRFVFMQKGPDYFDEPHQFVKKYMGDYDELPEIDNFRVFRRKPGL